MAVTGAIFKSLIFDDIDSRNYGVYITGEAVYNAPEREVEMITIAGRNGQLALDKGRFENIEVTYPAGIFADNQADYAKAISDFRNALCSKVGYRRLTDEYNVDEYRMAVYKSGLEVSSVNSAGEFQITFDCQPQRFLTSGETPITMGEWGETETASGDIATIENPNGIEAVKSLDVDIEPIQSGSGTPSPDNVRPISGRTEVETNRTGKNLLNPQEINFNKNYNGATYNGRAAQTISFPFGTYTFSVSNGSALTEVSVARSKKAFPVTQSDLAGVINITSNGTATITTDSNYPYLYLFCAKSGTISASDITAAQVQLEKGSTATDYEPYNGETYTTALGRTVYGGTLDVVSGELTVDRAMVDLGTLTWNRTTTSAGTYRFYAGDLSSSIKKPSTMTETSNLLCSRYVATYGNAPNASVQGICIHTNGNLMVYDSTLDDVDAAAFKTAMSGVQCVYPLATPQTYQLTAQQVELITGTNNIWSDGEVTVEFGENPSQIFNPTHFESKPMLEVEGYGTIEFNGFEIELENAVLGETRISDGSYNATVELNVENLNIGDAITSKSINEPYAKLTITNPGAVTHYSAYVQVGDGSVSVSQPANNILYVTISPKIDGLVYGTSATITTETSVFIQIGNVSNGGTFETTVTYDGSKKITINSELVSSGYPSGTTYTSAYRHSEYYGDSSKLLLGHPTYIDCDLGEAYKYVGDNLISLNQYIDLGSELPTFAVGSNEITFDNTITDLKVIPRWWIL